MKLLLALSVVATLLCSLTVDAQDNRMSFFVTSRGPGNGADLGGLAGRGPGRIELRSTSTAYR